MENTKEELKSLIAVDESDLSEKAVALTSGFAVNTGVHLTLLHVLEDVIRYDQVPETWVYHLREEKAKELLEKLKKIAEKNGVKHVDTKIAVGPVAEEIVRIAEEDGFSTIVVGTAGAGGFKRMLMGSVAEKVVLHAHCPVVVIR